MKIYNSPFQRPTIRWYMGKTRIGVPYFLPRKWVKFNEKDCLRKATEDCNNPNHVKYGFDPESVAHEYKRWSKPVPLTIGFSSCSLGWKTKWTDTDFRHEWNPVWSFVFFGGYQIAITFGHQYGSHYWEPWLYYEYATDHKLSQRERLAICRKEFSNTWTVYSGGEEGIINYYELILKPKYV
jgi:hypothetical protein